MFSTLKLVKRSEWKAKEPKAKKKINWPVKKIIIHKTNSRECWTDMTCGYYIKKLQKFHLKKDKKADIKYNFLVAANNRIYEGRGWEVQGEHTEGLDDQSYGIAFVMRYSDRPPDEQEIQMVKDIILYGLKKGYIAEDFEVIPHGDLTDDTLCPGVALLDDLINFPRQYRKKKKNS